MPRNLSNQSRALELMALLEAHGVADEEMNTLSRLEKYCGIPQRTLRDWREKPRKISPCVIEPLFVAAAKYLDPDVVRYSPSYLSISFRWWQNYLHAGSQAVLRGLRKKNCSEIDPDALRALRERAKEPYQAQDIDPKSFKEGAVATLQRDNGHYLDLIVNSFADSAFPSPEDATPNQFTSVLLLARHYRYTHDPDPDKHDPNTHAPDLEEKRKGAQPIIDAALDWLHRGLPLSDAHEYPVWARIERYYLIETILIRHWSRGDADYRLGLISAYQADEVLRKYTELVPWNSRAARNALALFSATGQQHRYADCYEHLLLIDPDQWKRPDRLRSEEVLDSDFDDFITWWKRREAQKLDRRRHPDLGVSWQDLPQLV